MSSECKFNILELTLNHKYNKEIQLKLIMCSAQKSQSNEDQEKVSIYSPFHSFNEMKP